MTYTNRPEDDEPAFPHDKLADVVLHKDDDPIIGGEEKPIDEPDDIRRTGQVEEWTGDGVNNGDCWFPIHFSYAGTDYTADVQKKAGTSPEYHITGVTPSVDHLPDPYVIAQHFDDDTYDFPINEMYYPRPFAEAVIGGIEDGANIKGRLEDE